MNPTTCQAKTTLSAEERRALDRPGARYGPPDDEVWGCELERGHSGRHLSAGEDYGPEEPQTWVTWMDGRAVVLVEKWPCESGFFVPDDDGNLEAEVMCTLPKDHVGLHSACGGDWWNDTKVWSDTEVPPVYRINV